MKFLDANIFIYAYYRPTKNLNEKESLMKKNSQKIIQKINNGEKVLTSVVHLSEISNILKRALNLDDLQILLLGLFSKSNIIIESITIENYLIAVDKIKDVQLDPNDCIALELMERHKITEIYSYDTGFDKIKEITRLP